MHPKEILNVGDRERISGSLFDEDKMRVSLDLSSLVKTHGKI